MAITKSAKKAHRASLKKRVYNVRRNRAVHDTVKEVRTLVTFGKKAEATQSLAAAYKAIDKAAKGNTISKNTAARKKSRLAAAVRKAQ